MTRSWSRLLVVLAAFGGGAALVPVAAASAAPRPTAVAATASEVSAADQGGYLVLPTSTSVGDVGPRCPDVVLDAPVVALAATGDAGWAAASDGGVVTCGPTVFYGSAAGDHLAAPVVAITATPSGHGYWLAAADGGVFAYGDARFEGSAGSYHLAAPVVAITATPSGHGYWLATADGGVFAFGDARFEGSAGSLPLRAPVVGMARDPSGDGYWLAAADGGVFAYGDAPFLGSAGAYRLVAPVSAILATTDGRGYWLGATDGGVFTYGDAPYLGSDAEYLGPTPDPSTGLVATPGGGYSQVLTEIPVDPAIAGHSGFDLARANFAGNEYLSAAAAFPFLVQAADYLDLGVTLDHGDRSGYPAAAAELRSLAELPETSDTPAQQAEGALDLGELAAFFATPG